MTAAPTPDRDALWRRYESTVMCGGTPQERAHAFDAWWKLEKADSLASTRADLNRVSEHKRRITRAGA